jgi:hypothetical protein
MNLQQNGGYMEEKKEPIPQELIKANQRFGNGVNKVIVDKITGQKLTKPEAMGLVEAEERTVQDFVVTNFKRKKNGPKRQ